ncbi:MAG TPA: MXAN_5187 C-terminal domain-containing protein, partial [Polyangiaceae bacterium]|nr:MXAN_5187 C-terminal domain-containing protein [Polyangiaceae bacterium]
RPGAPAAPVPPRAAPSAPAITRPPPPSAARPGPQSVTQASRAPQPAAGNLSEDRIRQIYAQYVREKRSRGESTATTTFESVARSLRSSSEKLRGQHAGRDVDFEVTEKDGRTILKPVVK